jgi:hypothetical protein
MPTAVRRTARVPATAASAVRDRQHAGDQDELVLGAERADREVLEPRRRRVDHHAADGDDR